MYLSSNGRLLTIINNKATREVLKHGLVFARTSLLQVRKFSSFPPRSHILKSVFDDQKFYNNFNKQANEHKGMFNNEYLKSPEGLVQFSKDSLQDAKDLVANMLIEVKKSDTGRLSFIRKLDQLSDVLCRVIDLAEFIRNGHTDNAWVDAAQETHEILFEYMNQLNTNVELYNNLVDVLNDKSIVDRLTEEEYKVGEYLKQDFEKSGIHMDDESRNNFVELTQEISVIGANYANGIQQLKSIWCEIGKKDFESIPDKKLRNEILGYQLKSPSYRKKPNVILVPLVDHIPYSILTSCPSETVRRKIWIAFHSASDHQIKLLNAFIKYRAVLSRMLGYESYAHHQLQHKMAKCPENVQAFLSKIQKTLIDSPDSALLKEIRTLYSYKDDADMTLSNEDIISEVKPWDRDYLLNKMQTSVESQTIDNDEIRNYLSIGSIMAGLNKLFSTLYKVELVPVPLNKGETWDNKQVRKIKVFDSKNKETMGYLYIDFWSPKVYPSHFTIACSRELNTSIGTEDKEIIKTQVPLDDTETQQLPVVCIMFNFQRPSYFGFKQTPTLLHLEQVDTIFHEMGHAMHSMIGRTKLQNLSGTRAVTDFVELPSVLMESFSKDPRVLCKIAKHYETGEPLSQEMFEQHQKQKVLLHECEIFMQSKMASLDQVLHDSTTVKAISENFDLFDTTNVYHNLESNLKLFADEWSTWHGKFLHLFSYGAVYYSYLLDRAIANKVYNELFSQDPWSPTAGQKYRDSVLKWGGTKDPWLLLADALNNDQLKSGDSKAMEIIASELK